MTEKTEAQTIIENSFQPRLENIDGNPFLIQDRNGSVLDLSHLLLRPTRFSGTKILTKLVSFNNFLKCRADQATTSVYVKELLREKFNSFIFEAVLNDDTDGPNHQDHKVVFKPGFTKPAQDWLEKDEKRMDQEEFALFIDKHLLDIRSGDDSPVYGMPTQAELLNFITSLTDSKNAKFSRKVNIQNGDVSFSLEKTVSDEEAERIKLFERFPVVLCPFEGFPFYQVTAKLRFRVEGGQVIFWYDLEGLEDMFIAARNFAIESIEKHTSLPVYI